MRRFFNWLFGASATVINSSEELLRELERSVSQGDVRLLTKLCRTHQGMILSHFPSWQKVPDSIRSNPSAMQSYLNTLVATAGVFERELKLPELMESLTGTEDSNPLLFVQSQFREGGRLKSEARYADAERLYQKAEQRISNAEGSIGTLFGQIQGELGVCRLQQRDSAGARVHFERALADCELHHDSDGVQVYLGNLYECDRYSGDSQSAARMARQFSELVRSRDPVLSARYARQAKIVEEGEPLNRAVVTIRDVTYEVDELPDGPFNRARFEFQRNRISLHPSLYITELGNKAAVSGQDGEALDYFSQAAEADPFDPDPHYQRAHVLLLSGQIADGLEACGRTEDLAPGWFHNRESLWLAEQVLLGRHPAEVFPTLALLDDGPLSPNERVKVARQALGAAPRCASLFLRLGRSLARADMPRDAEIAFRDGLACAEEPDVETRLCVELASLMSASHERSELLSRAQNPQGNLTARATAFVMEAVTKSG